MFQSVWQLILRHQDGLFAVLFVVSVALASFAAGGLVGRYQVFPYSIAREAVVGIRTIYRDVTNTSYDLLVRQVSEFSAIEAAASRIEDTEALTSGLLWAGGEGLFREVCPERGCLAVEFSSSGEVAHAYPYRLDDLNEWQAIVELPRSRVHPLQAPELLKVPFGVRKYSNGDLLVAFSYANASPWPGGVARVDREGMPVWVRNDYSHHWPTLFKETEGEELILVPGLSNENIDVGSRMASIGEGVDFDCDSLNYVDYLRVLDGNGSVLKDIRIVDTIIESPFAAVLFHSTDSCDLLHLNYIDRIREDATDMPGVYPGDYVISLRNTSSFGIMDSETGRIKQMTRGTFIHQHSVQHLKESKFLLFDNHGADIDAGPSRILLVDLAGGAVSERTVFPVPGTPIEYRFFSRTRGNISISHDRERIILLSSNEGVGLEVRLSDGAVLNVFRNVHDLTGLKHNLEEAGDRAIYFVFNDLQYVE